MFSSVRGVAGAIMLIYGSIGALVQLRPLPLLVKAATLWLGNDPATPHPNDIPLLSALEAHFDALPWLTWIALTAGLWLGVGIRTVPPAPVADEQGVTSQTPTSIRRAIPVLLVLLILAIGAWARLNVLVPQSAALIEYPYDDEGVYAMTSQLALQGIMPYRDYFFAHPPLAAFVYTPAFAYRFTEWGSPTSFVFGRYLSVAYSLLTALAIFAIGWRVSRRMWVGAVAALVWSLDGQIVEINRKIMLDQPMVLLSAAGLLIYLLAQGSRRPRLLLYFAGVVVGLAAMTKIAGLAAAMAIFSHFFIMWVSSRRQPVDVVSGGTDVVQPPQSTIYPTGGLPSGRNLQSIIPLLGGFLTSVLLLLVPFLILAPGQIVREVFFFQLLRPGDGTDAVGQRMTLLTGGQLPDGTISPLLNQNPLTLILAAAGVAVLAAHVWRGGRLGGWAVVLLWNIFNFLLFTYSRSFYTHYYIQIAAPLCLLAGAVVLTLPRRIEDRTIADRTIGLRRYSAVVGLVAVLLFAAPLLWVQAQAITRSRPDNVFEVVGRYVNNALQPDETALTLDAQFNFMAARSPSYLPRTGYLVDSYGHMIYLGLGLSERSIGDLFGGVLRDPRTSDPYPIMWRDRPQQDYRDRLARSRIVVLHDVGEGRLREDTRAAVGAAGTLVSPPGTRKYQIYRINPQ